MPPLAHETAGDRDARPLVLLHGFPFSRGLWHDVVPRLGARARVVAPDLPGFGASPAGPDTMDGYAQEVLALADALGAAEFDLAAHSMGGYVAFALLRREPARVRRLALVTTRAAADTEEARAARTRQAEAVEREGVRALAEPMLAKVVSPRASAPVREAARRAMGSATVPGVVRALRAMAGRPDATALLPALRQPALVVAGADDAIVPVEEQERMAAALPRGRFAVLEGSAHLPMLEEPEAFATALLGHLR